MKKIYRISLYALCGAALLTGGVFVALDFSSESGYFKKTDTTCKFNPYVAPDIEALIEETIVTVANTNLLSLWGKKSHLTQIGDTISHETTNFSYWAYVFSSAKLSNDMKKIQSSSTKYEGFLKGTQNKFIKEYQENHCLFIEAKGFAKYLHLPEDKILALLIQGFHDAPKNKLAFKPFLDYIINERNGFKPNKISHLSYRSF
jgi:hypothetical protein